MEHELRTDDGVSIIALRGPVDVASSIALRGILAAAVGHVGARVLLDLSEVTLIDSSGVGVLVAAHREAEASGSTLVLAAPAGPAARVFELTRTNKLLRIEPTLDAGLTALR
jgi:anti-anti-sigma factor